MSPQQLGGAAKHVCPNLIVKNCINSGIVCSFLFLFFFSFATKLLDRVLREWASELALAWETVIWETGRWCDRVMSVVTFIKTTIWFMLLQKWRWSGKQTRNKSLTELLLKNSNFKRFCSSTLLQCFWSVIIHVWWASDIDSVVGSSSEGWFASGGKKLYSAVRKRGEKN